MDEHSLPTDPPLRGSLSDSLDEPEFVTEPAPPPDESPAHLFASLVGQMLEPIKADMKATRRIAQQCFEAVVRVEGRLERQQLEIGEIRGVQSAQQLRLDALETRLRAVEKLLPCLEVTCG